MYYAVRVQYHAQGQKQAGKYFLKAGNLCYADDVDSMGRIGKFKTDKDGSPLIAQEGQYELTFSVPVSDQKVTARIDGMKVTITTLNACFLGGKDTFQDKVDQKTGTRIPEAYLFMKDGSKVEVISEATTTEGNLLCGLERPVDTEQIRSLEFQGKEYPVK